MTGAALFVTTVHFQRSRYTGKERRVAHPEFLKSKPSHKGGCPILPRSLWKGGNHESQPTDRVWDSRVMAKLIRYQQSGQMCDTTNLNPPGRRLLPSQNIQLFKPLVSFSRPVFMLFESRLLADHNFSQKVQIICR